MTLWTTKVQYPCLWTDLKSFFSLTWKFDRDSKSDIVLYLKCLTRLQKSNFLFMDRFVIFLSLWLGNSMGIPYWYFTLPQITQWTLKNQISCLWTDFNNFFPLTWKFDGDSQSDILYFTSNDSLNHKSL